MRYFLSALLTICLSTAATLAAEGEYDRVRTEMKQQLEKVQADGTVKMSKQFRRWEWFWSARHKENGDFMPASHYMNEVTRLNARKREPDMQAAPTWVELGPTGPSNVPHSSAWNGIGRVNCLEISRSNPDLLFLGSAQGGVWKSTDAGNNWKAVNVPILPVFGVSDIAIAPSNSDIIYVATGDADASIPGVETNLPGFSYGIIKSTDGGETWALTGLSVAPANNDLVARLWVDPRNADIVIAGTYSGIRRTTDGGASWSQVSTGAFFRDLIGNIDQPDILHAASSSRAGGAAIYRSIDNGKTWTVAKSVPAAQRIRLAVTKANDGLVIALAARADDNGMEGIYKSLDKGATYNRVPVSQNLLGWSASGNSAGGQGQYDLALDIHQNNANFIFVGGVNIWRSTNGGGAWTLSAHNDGQGAPWVHADQHFLKAHHGRNVVYACHDGGIARSTDYGVSWTDISRGLRIQQYYSLSTSKNHTTLTLAGAQDNSTMLTTNGTTFSHVLAGDGMDSAIDPENPQVVYASSQYGNFAVSFNTGGNWGYIANPQSLGEPGASWVTPIITHPLTTGIVFTGYTQVHKSVNYGSSWTTLSNFPATETLRNLAISPSDPNYILAAFSSSVYFTTNGGASWQSQNGVGAGFIQDVQIHPTNPKRWWVTYGGFTSTKIVEVNNGIVTNITGAGLPNVPCNAVFYQAGMPSRMYVGTDIGVFFKDENSSSWAPFGQGMPTTIITDLEFIPSTTKLRVSTYGRGIWEISAPLCAASQPVVQVVGPSSVCSGDTIVLQASDGFSKYMWSNGSTARSIRLGNISESGNYTVNVEDGNGCTNVSAPVSITIKRSPTKQSISRRGGDTLRSSIYGGITGFQWYLGDTPVPGATSREFVPTADGIYSVVVMNADGCTSRTDPYTFVKTSTAVEIESSESITMYPNPATDEIRVELPRAARRSIEVVNAIGDVVQTVTIGDEATGVDLPLSGLAAGTYFVRIHAGESVWMKRFVKQ